MDVAQQITRAVRTHSYRWTSENDLQLSIASVFRTGGIEYEREVRLSDKDRIDFLCGDVGVEVKVDGSKAATQRQLVRYLASDQVRSLVLVTAKAKHIGIVLPFVDVVWIGAGL